jgi:4-amino-4-deoxy-L-arabinose transferase-like glycosyltransferase
MPSCAPRRAAVARLRGLRSVPTATGAIVEPAARTSAKRSDIYAFIALAFLAALYCVRLGAGSLWDNSEPQYGEIVKEMLRSGDWLTLHKDLQPWFVHPPLWFWAAASSAKIFGLSEFSLRLPSAVFGVACGCAIYAAGRRIYGETAGVAAALALGLSLEILVMARLAIQDTMLVCALVVSTFWGWFALRDRDAKALWIAAVATALGTLVKGPVALVLPGLTLLAWAAWTKRWRSFAGLPWIGAIVAYVAIAGSWFAAEAAVNGPRFLYAYFGSSNVGRFLSPYENQPGPIWYYVPLLVVGFFPFIAFVPQALVRAWRSGGDDGKFLIAAAAVPFVFFSVAQTKLPNYIEASFPALAVAAGETIAAAVAARSMRPLRGALLSLLAAVVILAIGVYVYGRAHASGLMLALMPSLALLGWLVVPIALLTFALAARLDRPSIAPVGLSAMMGAFICVVVFAVLPQIEATAKPMKAMAAEVMSVWRPGDRICFDGVHQGFSLDYYTDGPPITSVGHNVDDVPPKRYFASKAPAVCVVSPDAYADLVKRGIRLALIEKTPTLWLVTYDAAVP